MKEFSSQAIEQTKSFLEGKNFPVENSKVGNLEVSYWIIPQSLNPTLPDFAFRMTNTDSATGEVLGIFGVSESVPQELRPYWAAHEIIEFTQIGIGKEGRCEEAEKTVVNLLPDNLRRQYIDKRILFFSNLVNFFQQELIKSTEDYTENDVKEAQDSLAYLQSLI